MVVRVEDLGGGELTGQAEFASERVARQDERAGANDLGRVARPGVWGEKLNCELD
jgi:hypothetical protein